MAAAATLVGAGHVDPGTPPVTGSEDFSFMLEARPGGFVFIGNGDEGDGEVRHVHTPGYGFNDGILALGAACWVKLVEMELHTA